MKKAALSLFVFVASAAYVVYQYMGGTTVSATVASTNPPTTSQITTSAPASTSFTRPSPPTSVTSQTTTTPAPSQTPPAQTQPTTPPPPVAKPKGQYADGTYTGSTADAYYGYVQVKATIQGGKLTAVDFLQYPSDRSTSRYINSQAMPLLQQEAISAQSANVSGVSGATDTSMAFIQSLGNALAQAKNA